VAAPLVRPTTFAVAALAFVVTWGNFIDPLLFLNDPDLATLPLGLRSLAALGPTSFPVLLAGALVATLPAAIAFALVQRRFLQNTREAGWLGR
jgi:multiple sugar transport system permease protein